MESLIEVLCKQVDDLKKDLALNASMLARQCDLAREAETQALRLRCCGNCKHYCLDDDPEGYIVWCDIEVYPIPELGNCCDKWEDRK